MNDLSEFVVLNDSTLTTDSRRVAKHFKKRHDNVLRAYDKLGCSDEFRALNYEVTIADVAGPKGATRQERIVRMTKDGFAFLAMGFTGKQADKFKEAFINAFNAMNEQLQRIGANLWAQYLDLEKRDATSFMWASFGAKRMVERKRDKPLLENERALLESEIQPALFSPNGLIQ